MPSIAILGATGQIGRGLAQTLGRDPAVELRLFARTPEGFRPEAIALGLVREGRDKVRPLPSFEDERYDVVINAAGAGSRARQLALGAEQLRVTEEVDRRVLAHLAQSPESAYVYLSTGAVYGFDREWPIPENSAFRPSMHDPDRADVYPLSKLAAEARHRRRPERIYDIRVFGYFSRFIGLDDDFFLSEVARAVVRGTPLRTTRSDMVRDYVDQAELAGLIQTLVRASAPNGTFDIYSSAPVGKQELLACLGQEFGLRVDYQGTPGATPAGVTKPPAPSACRKAAEAGHLPRRSSKDIVVGELKELLAIHRRAHAPTD